MSNQDQKAALDAAINELKQAVSQEMDEVNARVAALEEKANEQAIDLSEEIASIREATARVSGIVTPTDVDTAVAEAGAPAGTDEPTSGGEEEKVEDSE